MTPVRFEQCNFTLAERQPEYQPLPAHWHPETAVVTTCWKLSTEEIQQVVAYGHIFIQQLTFKHPLQPQMPSVLNPLTNKPAVIEVPHVERIRYERDRYLEILQSIKPLDQCPFCTDDEPCYTCRTMAGIQGSIQGSLERLCNSVPNKTVL